MKIELFRVGLAFILAVIPACIWGFIFYKKQQGQKSMMLKTFIAGALLVSPLLAYKALWQYFPWINAFQYTHQLKDDFIGFSTFGIIPLDVLATFMIVGVIEEMTKLWAVKITDQKTICSIDDAIEMAITAALGFAFAENILYFYNIIASRGFNDVLYPFVFRSLFSTFAHIMFSGILGYYYGVAIFATDEIKEEQVQKKWRFGKKIAQLMHWKKDTVFHEEKMAEGLVIAISLHAFFNIFLEMNWVFLLVPYLTAGFIYVSYLLEKKESHKAYCTVDNNRNDL